MKRKFDQKCKVIMSLCLILAILTVIGIGAYLTDTEVKSDVYTVGNVQAEIVSNGDMKLDNVGALLPGTVHVYERAATNTGINDAYVFMSLTIPYEMVGAANEDGSHIGERIRQLFIPGSIGSEWKLVDVGFFSEYEIEENGQYCGEHDTHSVVVGDTITYIYGFIGDNTDGSLKILASGETTSNLIETMQLTNLYNISKVEGEISTSLYAIQSTYVNGGITDVNGVWAVINKALFAPVETATLTYTISNTRTGDAIGYAPLRLVDERGNTVATSVADEYGNGQFQNVGSGNYSIETDIGNLTLNNTASTYSLRRTFAVNRSASVELAGEDKEVDLGLTAGQNTLIQGNLFNKQIASSVTSIKFVKNVEIPATAKDVSEENDGTIMAWTEGTIMYVASTNGGVIYAHPNSAYMFQNKTKLTSVETDNLNMSMASNTNRLFYSCTALTSVDYLKGLTTVGIGMFDGCTALTSYTIPNTVTWIGAIAFEKTAITEIVIPDSVTYMEDRVFQYCKSLTYAYISSNLEVIESQTFNNCSALTTVAIPQNSKLQIIKENAFYNDGKLASINLPSNISYIGDKAFYGCSALTSIKLPESITYLGKYAFYSCKSLTSANILCNIDAIQEYTFYNCTSLKNISLSKGITTIGDYAFYKSGFTTLVVPNTVSTINQYAFAECPNLTTVVFSEGIKTIGLRAFYRCSKLTKVNFPYGLEYIQTGAFDNCSLSASDMIFPDTLKLIGGAAFYYCNFSNVENIHIPGSVKTIEVNAFYFAKVQSVTFGYGVETIGSSAFEGCRTTTLELPASITKLGDKAFGQTSALKTLTLSNSITDIGASVFNYTSTSNYRIETINFCGTEEEWNASGWASQFRPSTTINFNYVPEN